MLVLSVMAEMMRCCVINVNVNSDDLFVLLLYVPSQQLWSLRDGQFT